RLGADLAARVGLPHRRDDAQLLLPLIVRCARAGGGAAGPARDVGRAAAARHELHRSRTGTDMGRRSERLVQGAWHAPRASNRTVHAHALLRHRDLPLSLARAHAAPRGSNRMIGLRPFVATCLVLMISENVTPNE